MSSSLGMITFFACLTKFWGTTMLYSKMSLELGGSSSLFFVTITMEGGVEGADKMGSVQNKTFKMPKKQNDRY